MGRQKQTGIGSLQQHRVRKAMDTFAERPVSDLIVCLKGRHEGRQRQVGTGFAAQDAITQQRRLALVREAFGQRATEAVHWRVGIVDVIAFGLPSHDDVRRVMQVIVPLGRSGLGSAIGIAPQKTGLIQLVFEHYVDCPASTGAITQRRANLVHDVDFRVIANRVDGVHAQAVEAVLLNPVQRVVNEKIAHSARLFRVVIDGGAPRRLVAGVEEMRAARMQVVTFGTEVVVDHVDQHHHPQCVRRIDEGLQLVRRSVDRIGCELQHTVVAPVALAGKVGERHQLDGGDAQIGQRRQAPSSGRKVALGSEGANVQFIDHRFFPRAPVPIGILPCVGTWIDDFAVSMHVVRIATRCRVGHSQPTVQTVPIEIARPGLVEFDAMPPPGIARHAVRYRDLTGAVLQIDMVGARCPQCKAHPAVVLHCRAEGHRVHARR